VLFFSVVPQLSILIDEKENNFISFCGLWLCFSRDHDSISLVTHPDSYF